MWNKFANVTPALHVIPVHIIVPWLSKITSHFESLTQKYSSFMLLTRLSKILNSASSY